MRLFITLAFVLAIGLVLGQKLSSEAEEQVTFRALCGTCHGTSLVEGLRTEEEWREEVDQMIKIGARGTEGQFRIVMRLLARTLTKVNVNTAEARQIAPVLEVSEEVAEALVKRRTANGDFKTVDELKQIPGVDAAKVEARKERIMF